MSSEVLSSRVYRRNTNRGPDFVFYIVSVEGERFFLTDGQLQSEPSNLLNLKAKKPTEILVGSDEDTIIETDVNLFRLIHAHLRGFEIFPLPPQGVPFGGQTKASHVMYPSPEATLKNLLRDATDFGFTNLVAKIKQEMVKASKETKTQLADEEAAKDFVILD